MAILMTDRWNDDPQVQDDPALGAFLRDLAGHADEDVDPATRASTLEVMLEVAARAPSTSRPTPWARRARRVLGLTGVKVALVAGVAAATTTGGLAATGSLPAPIQSFAHDVGRQIGIGVPDAPGQQKQLTDEADTGRDFAPGQLKKSELGTTGRDHAPGQQGDEDTSDGSDAAPVGDPSIEELSTDTDQPRRVAPDEGPPTGVVPQQSTPGDAAPETPGEPEQAPERPDPPPPPDQDPPAGAANETTPDPATAPGRPDAPAEDHSGGPQGPSDDTGTRGSGR